MVGPTSDDHFLNVLPLYHVLALVINFIVPLYLGARVTFLQSLEAQKILKTFREEGISIFICVPQFYYLVHRRILQEVERQGFLKRFLFRRLLAVSRFSNLRLGLNPGRLSLRRSTGSSGLACGCSGWAARGSTAKSPSPSATWGSACFRPSA